MRQTNETKIRQYVRHNLNPVLTLSSEANSLSLRPGLYGRRCGGMSGFAMVAVEQGPETRNTRLHAPQSLFCLCGSSLSGRINCNTTLPTLNKLNHLKLYLRLHNLFITVPFMRYIVNDNCFSHNLKTHSLKVLN